jgi:phage regulator Rha-like protein
MDELVIVKRDEIFTDSLIIAKGSDNEHESVISLISKYKNDIEYFGLLKSSDLKSDHGQTIKRYELNEQQATFILTLLRNSKPVVEFKKKLTEDFYRMRRFILERQTAEWQQSRTVGKLVRKDETDIILTKLIPLAEAQGSKNAGKLYMTYSKLVNMTLEIEAGHRNELPLEYIDAIKFLERAIENIISIEVDKGTHYKEIYQICKAKCQIIKELAFLPRIPQIKIDSKKLLSC